MEEKTYINVCKAFSDRNRMKIFKMLLEKDMCAFEILKFLNCSQPTLSYHMKLLTDCGIVNGEKRGLWMHYSVNYELLDEFQHYSTPRKRQKSKRYKPRSQRLRLFYTILRRNG